MEMKYDILWNIKHKTEVYSHFSLSCTHTHTHIRFIIWGRKEGTLNGTCCAFWQKSEQFLFQLNRSCLEFHSGLLLFRLGTRSSWHVIKCTSMLLFLSNPQIWPDFDDKSAENWIEISRKMAPLSTFHNFDYGQQATLAEMNNVRSCRSFSGSKRLTWFLRIEETASMWMEEAFVINNLPYCRNPQLKNSDKRVSLFLV